jgi:hypothetical protein
MERRRPGGMGAGPHDKRFRAEKESTFVNRAQRAPGVWGLAPMKTDQIKQVKSTEQAPTCRVYITRSLVSIIREP